MICSLAMAWGAAAGNGSEEVRQWVLGSAPEVS
jgi:hypothetical protein